jgi:hypothetical protein
MGRANPTADVPHWLSSQLASTNLAAAFQGSGIGSGSAIARQRQQLRLRLQREIDNFGEINLTERDSMTTPPA